MTAMSAARERGGGAAGGDDLPAQLCQALGEGDDPALVADRDQRARHDDPVTTWTPRYGEAAPDGLRPRRRARRPAAGGAPPRAPARPAGRACRRRARAPGHAPRIAPRSYSSSTRWTVAPLSARPARQDGLVHAVAVHAAAAEGRQQRGMHVHDPVAVAGDDGGGNQLQVAGQHEQVHPVMRSSRARASRRHPAGSGSTSAGDGVAARQRERAGVRPVAEDQHHRRAGARRGQGPQQRLEVAAAVPRRPRPRASSWAGK